MQVNFFIISGRHHFHFQENCNSYLQKGEKHGVISINQQTVQNLEDITGHSVKGIKKIGTDIKVNIKPRFYFWQFTIENLSELCLHREKNSKLLRKKAEITTVCLIRKGEIFSEGRKHTSK